VTEKIYTDIEKLQMLITHWLQHNESHGKEYAKWAAVARQAGHSSAAECIEQAVDLLAKADKAFVRALESVGGPSSKGHQHHHHHD
jgi:fructose-bisphosphate aldolase class 1